MIVLGLGLRYQGLGLDTNGLINITDANQCRSVMLAPRFNATTAFKNKLNIFA